MCIMKTSMATLHPWQRHCVRWTPAETDWEFGHFHLVWDLGAKDLNQRVCRNLALPAFPLPRLIGGNCCICGTQRAPGPLGLLPFPARRVGSMPPNSSLQDAATLHHMAARHTGLGPLPFSCFESSTQMQGGGPQMEPLAWPAAVVWQYAPALGEGGSCSGARELALSHQGTFQGESKSLELE